MKLIVEVEATRGEEIAVKTSLSTHDLEDFGKYTTDVIRTSRFTGKNAIEPNTEIVKDVKLLTEIESFICNKLRDYTSGSSITCEWNQE